MRPRNLAAAVIIAALAAVPASATGDAPRAGTAKTVTVRVADNHFSPRSVRIRRGSAVRWRWVGDNFHNVVATRGARFRSPTKRSGSYRRTFRRRGTVRVVCTLHSGMRMIVRVR